MALLTCLCTVLDTTHSQSGNRNYILTRTFTKDDGTTYQDKVDYYDGLGQILLTRQIQRDGVIKDLFDTYYIYNDFGNLVAVLPSEVSKIFSKSGSFSWRSDTDMTLLRFAFLYKYDSRNLQIATKLPGCSWNFCIYDKGDRLVFSQDGNMRTHGEWFFSIPDALGKEQNTYRFGADGMNAVSIQSKYLQLLKATPLNYTPLP